jgi:hypothetical protein
MEKNYATNTYECIGRIWLSEAGDTLYIRVDHRITNLIDQLSVDHFNWPAGVGDAQIKVSYPICEESELYIADKKLGDITIADFRDYEDYENFVETCWEVAYVADDILSQQ